jgi:hypothetical protein
MNADENEKTKDESDPTSDAFCDACISLKVPLTGKPWLNKLIRASRRLDLLQAAVPNCNPKLKTVEGSAISQDPHFWHRFTHAAEAYGYDTLEADSQFIEP